MQAMAVRLASEPTRLQALQGYGLLDTPAEPELDDLVRLCAQVLDAPIALLSLVDSHRQFFKSRVGLDLSESPREGSFCSHAIQGDDLFVVPDATRDPRFQHHELVVGEPHLRFYAAMPLVTDRRAAIGTLCVIDTRPRGVTADQATALRVLAAELMTRLEQRRIAAVRDGVVRALDKELRAEVGTLRDRVAESLTRGQLARGEAERIVQLLSGIERVDASIDSVADLVRFGLGKPPSLERRDVDVRELCHDMIEDLAAGAGVRFELTAEGDCSGRWDPARLSQAALLLFEEARARSPASGEVQVNARGLPEAVLLDVTIPAAAGEPGLRIHLGRELIQAMGGRVEFRHEGGKTIFSICLPRDPPI